MTIKIKRIYEEAKPSDGYRILVDRLWPRGIKKEAAKIDLWLKDIAPSNELRKWFNHDAGKWSDFKRRYIKELSDNPDLINEIKRHAKGKTVTLLFASKELQHNNAVVLQGYLK